MKPGNLLVSTDAGTVKLADFGIAKAAKQTRITQVGSVLGTAAYLSPEQARGEEAGPVSDIYSLGVCAYQFLAGRLPHEYSSLTELALKQQNDEVESIRTVRPEVPEALDRAIRLALHVEPERRYASSLEMAQAVTAGARGDDTEATIRLSAESYADDIAATQALPRTEYARQSDPTMVAPIPAREREPRRAAPPARAAPAAPEAQEPCRALPAGHAPLGRRRRGCLRGRVSHGRRRDRRAERGQRARPDSGARRALSASTRSRSSG